MPYLVLSGLVELPLKPWRDVHARRQGPLDPEYAPPMKGEPVASCEWTGSCVRTQGGDGGTN